MAEIGLLLFPNLTQLDLTGPLEVVSRFPESRTHLIWKSLDPVISDSGLCLTPTARFADAPPLDIILVPGGPGIDSLFDDDETLSHLRTRAAEARLVTAVCTGSLVLGAAGLLDGYRATTHWAYLDLLSEFGAVPVSERVVIDRDRMTGGGVTAGIDLALTMAAELFGEMVAKQIQLAIEYAPAPPYASGRPETADPEVLETVSAGLVSRLRRRRELVVRAAALREGIGR